MGDPADAATVLYSRDGSYLRLKLSSHQATPGGYLVGDVESPDGTVRRFTRASSDWSVPFRLASIKDAFTNVVTVTYPSATQWTISDGHRSHQVHFTPKTVEGLTVQYVSSVTLAAFVMLAPINSTTDFAEGAPPTASLEKPVG